MRRFQKYTYYICKYYDNWNDVSFLLIIRSENFNKINKRLESEDKTLMEKRMTYTFREAQIVRSMMH